MRAPFRNRLRPIHPLLAVCAALLGAGTAGAEPPTAQELLKRLGIPEAAAREALDGSFVSHSLEPSNERELTAGFVFVVPGITPGELMPMLNEGLVDRVDPNVVATAFVGNPATAAEFAKLDLRPDPGKQARAFASAKPGSDLNLSSDEIAAFQQLDGGNVAAVEKQVRAMLLARMQSYQQQGLAGLAPYARGGQDSRSPADDLRSASNAAKVLREEMPNAHQLMLAYPKGKPGDIQETFRWQQILAHGEPTLILAHNFALPDGDAWVVVQRQLYVSTGYNCEQAVAAFLPIQDGTAVFYANRTSTDQVTGFGGGAKRSIGGKVLAGQLQELFEKVRGKTAGGGK